MHYMGSKAKHAKDIVAITLANRRPDQTYVEPFVGGGNVINIVPQGAGRIANDKNFAMVALLDALGNKGWEPPAAMTQAEFRKLMKRKNDLQAMTQEEQALFAFAATGLTFGSQWAGQWVKEEQRCRQAHDACMRAAPGLQGIEFHSGSYDALNIPPGSIVYCDPPYSKTTGYAGATTTIKVGESDHNIWKPDTFWRWADSLVDAGHHVYVSEYTGPSAGAFRIPATPAQKEALGVAKAARRAMDADPKTPSDAIVAANEAIFAIERDISANSAAHVAQWQVLWQKEVISDFSAAREEGTNSGKVEVEKLFHRVP
jgi:DNA adenine methylase